MKKLILPILFLCLILSAACAKTVERPDDSNAFALELTLVEIAVREGERITLHAADGDTPDPYNYVIYVTEETDYDFDMNQLSSGQVMNVYVEAVMESYPMQAYATKIVLIK